MTLCLPPAIALKFCYGCRAETEHVRKGRFYQCPCGAPLREITDPVSPERRARELAAEASLKETWRRESQEQETRQYTRRPMKFIEEIRKLVKEQVAGMEAGVNEKRVREIVQEELLAAVTGGAVEGECPRGKHPGRHGKKCKAAGYVA